MTIPSSTINAQQYHELYRQSVTQPEQFWGQQASLFLTWKRPWDKVIGHSQQQFAEGRVRWFEGGQLNVTYNCIDRHLPERGSQTAFIWVADEPGEDKVITYSQLSEAVNRLANVLKRAGIGKGNRVSIYMPMIPEAIYAMLACARIGAIHSVVFGGFSPEALKNRILDSDCQLLITADEGLRGGRRIPLKQKLDIALQHCPKVEHCIVVRHTGNEIDWLEPRDIDYHSAVAEVSAVCEPQWMDAEDPLFILYTSGSTGKPKGVLHSSAGYLLQAAMTFHYNFNYQEGDLFWCTADVGWVTGHSYIVYGPLSMAASSLIFEGVPTYPDASRYWQIIDHYGVNQFYTAPTAIRALRAQGDQWLDTSSRSSLKLLGTVGEPIDPEAWNWYYEVVGNSRCPIVDTWWQTETGAQMISPLPKVAKIKPGCACLPFFGVQPAILDEEGKEIEGPGKGSLVIKAPWPAQLRTLFGDHKRLIETYFSRYKGYYFTGDGASRDADGYYWISGRIDDVLNVSGHRISTAEIECALLLHEKVAEAAVVGYPHPIKGQGIYAYVTLMVGRRSSDQLRSELSQLCVQEIGAIAKLDFVQWAPAGLPKTRSGKIMRRILRKIAENDIDHLGDVSTLADSQVVRSLVRKRFKQ